MTIIKSSDEESISTKMGIKLIKNFIKEKPIFNSIKKLLMSKDFPYFYHDSTANEFDKSNFFFAHVLHINGEPRSSFFNQLAMPLLGRLNFNYLHRAKINLFTKQEKHFVSEPHRDMDANHYVALFSVNTNNGYTLFEDGTKVPSVENQCLIFNGSLKHSSATQTDEKVRININLNLS